MAQILKCRLEEGPYPPICWDCAMYTLQLVYIFGYGVKIGVPERDSKIVHFFGIDRFIFGGLMIWTLVIHSELYGDFSQLYGDFSQLYGDCNWSVIL